ncbi:WcaF family extracellular polysaccharide biosynthesis acetyltransferase [Mucilaginibacter sp. UR6-11]|uniref:WcaF family extracellular polysaccharide biosynthesis acetyltransferase n=1 Tax=Mucilaginibacter sp. UR6-11 TaxID=1435644 RepID=UPI001E658861|nr:WcaF family extracellular polysaccharide biosynthesis acetyltransferase [Mucilaginibacter sp. UR6-11]MCC8425746.1 WcaF family extracellular polysaccharide biosynthesis acetyltransferase [Mucilaginibacter sp. UR6-11]
MQKTDLESYNNFPYHPGGSAVKRILWYYINGFVFKTSLFPVYGIKVALLRLFGAKIGRRVEVKPCVNIKYPWLLTIGDEVWIGEDVWIDNLVEVTIGSNVCLSQGAVILTGSHNYKKTSFNLITGNVVIEDGVWVGAKAIVTQGIILASHAVLTAGSVATKNLENYCIYQGNPAVKVREREIS